MCVFLLVEFVHLFLKTKFLLNIDQSSKKDAYLKLNFIDETVWLKDQLFKFPDFSHRKLGKTKNFKYLQHVRELFSAWKHFIVFYLVIINVYIVDFFLSFNPVSLENINYMIDKFRY